MPNDLNSLQLDAVINKKRKRKKDWELLLIGNTYNWLTVISIEQSFDYNNRPCGYLAVCRCRCGNIAKVSPSEVFNGNAYSCGCYKSSSEFISKQHAWQSDKDKTAKRVEKFKQHLIDHPETLHNISDSNKQYWRTHPDKVRARAEKRSKRLMDDSNIALKISNGLKKYYKEHPDVRDKISKSMHEFCRLHPEIVASRAQKYKEWFANNPDKVAKMIENQQLWRKDSNKLQSFISNRKKTLFENPDIQENAVKKFKEWAATHKDRLNESLLLRLKSFEKRRSECDFSELINIIHEDYISDLLSGKLASNDIVRTRCPLCNEYCEHLLGNVFIFSTCSLKHSHPLLCNKCASSIYSSMPEHEIADYISTFYNGELIRNSREIIPPLELDLYYPDKRIAIEFNGDYWHDENHKPNDYHYNKFMICKDKGILLVSIFESEWDSNNESIKSYLYDLFNGNCNSLSYIDNVTMNNNFPDINKLSTDCVHIDHFYETSRFKVYTCGFSKLV